MAENKTTEILEFKVDQGAAITELERTRKAMIALKEEQGELQKAYKKGDITLEEYAKELTRVDLVQKRLSSNHSDLQKKVTGTSSAFDKFTKSLQSSTQNLTIAGTNVGALGGAVTKLLSPVGAAVAVVGALGAAYARSTVGAKDLEFVSNQLSATTSLLSNAFAKMFSSAEDGEGAITKLFNSILESFGPAGVALAATTHAIASFEEQLDDLRRNSTIAQGEAAQRMSEISELQTELAETATTYERKMAIIAEIGGKLKENLLGQVGALQAQLDIVQNKRKIDKDNEKLKDEEAVKILEIESIQFRIGKLIEKNNRAEDDITAAHQKQLDLLKEQARQRAFRAGSTSPDGTNFLELLKDDLGKEVKIESDAAESMFSVRRQLAERTKKLDDKALDNFRNNERAKEIFRNHEIDSIGFLSDSLGRAFTENTIAARRFAAVQILIDAGLTLASIIKDAAKLGPIAGPIYLVGAGAAAAVALKRAAALAGVPFGGFGAVSGEIFTAANGKQYTVVNGKTVELNEKGKVPFFKRAFVDNFIGAITLRPVRKAISGNEFSEGGFTGHGDTYEPAGIVHRGEVVWNKKDVAAIGGPTIANMIRPTYKGYANGGIVTPSGGMLTAADVINIVSAMPPNALVYKEFRSFEKGVIMKEQSTTR